MLAEPHLLAVRVELLGAGEFLHAALRGLLALAVRDLVGAGLLEPARALLVDAIPLLAALRFLGEDLAVREALVRAADPRVDLERELGRSGRGRRGRNDSSALGSLGDTPPRRTPPGSRSRYALLSQ